MDHNLRFVKSFLLLAIAIVAFVVSIVFVSFYIRTEELTKDILLQQSRALFKQILLTRRWASGHGGVYVKVKPGVEANPFLSKMPKARVNIRDQKSGELYTLRNPGLIVRELSEVGGTADLYLFHVASLKPVNPKNSTPDAFEKKALKQFENGVKELTTIEHKNGESFYRYMAPLYYEKACDTCHLNQGLKPGDIRGGISVSIPMLLVNQKLRANRTYTIASAILILGLLLGSLYIISSKLLRALGIAQSKLIQMATTDSLTELPNRKHGIDRLEEEISRHHRSGLPLSCLMLDIDRFKDINDTIGHLAGDAVLVSLADTFNQCTRKHDIVSRYGGEEFLILLPETDITSALGVAEKIRVRVSEYPVEFNDHSISFTVSIGVTQMDQSRKEATDVIIHRADCALYKAKAEGRNCVKTLECSNQDIHPNSA